MKILFVSHAATRGGAVGVLLGLVQFLKREEKHNLAFVCARSGPMEGEFARVAVPLLPVRSLRLATQLAGARRRLGELGVPRLAVGERVLKNATRWNALAARVGKADFDVIYANSASSGDAVRLLEPLLRRGAKLVVHVHELNWALSQCEPGWTFLKQRGDFFIACSQAVRDELIEQNIAPSKIEVVYEWTNFEALECDAQSARQALRAQLKAPEDAVIVGGCGTIEARKGADWWAQAAFYALGTQPNAHKTPSPLYFAWLGGQNNALRRQIERDLRGWNAHARVQFLPPSNEPHRFFAGLDVFCLSSREDPFPLVAIEAAAQNVPAACFQNAGGAVELVRNDAGVIVPWGDCAAMGRALASLGRDESFRRQLGGNAARRAHELCDADGNAARVREILERVAGS